MDCLLKGVEIDLFRSLLWETYSCRIRKPTRLTARRTGSEAGRRVMRYIASLRFHYDNANGSQLRFASISGFGTEAKRENGITQPCFV